MSFTSAERENRHRAIHQMVKSEGLRALILMGDTNVGWDIYGDLRYYTNNRVIFYRHVAVILPESASVHFVGSAIQKYAAERFSFVKDCRQSDNFIADVADLLKEHAITSGRIGVSLETFPVAWYKFLQQALPNVECVDAHDGIMAIRFRRSREEVEMYRAAAPLADAGFDAALKVIRPGVSEYEIAAEIEHAARLRGGEDHFTLVGSGKFSFGGDHTLPLPYAPSHRCIELGDTVVMEITPRRDGYWTQLVRTVTVGRPNEDLLKIHRVCCDALQKGLEQLRPGKRVKDVVLTMAEYVKERGYLFRPPTGHICGVDLVEDRITPQNETVLEPGNALIIHPTVFTPDEKRNFFWGETYLVSTEGYERLHRSGDTLLTV